MSDVHIDHEGWRPSLADFLWARIGEDEKWAAESGRAHIATHGLESIVDEPQTPGFYVRVLAECESKRRIIRGTWGRSDKPAEYNEGLSAGIDFACRMLALPYADHPDFREEWRT